jgi:general secretion pathway protein G
MTSSRSPFRSRRARSIPGPAGFTLIELMLVVAIIGILASVAVWSIAGQGDSARINASKMSLRTIKSALEQYQLSHSAFPASLTALATGATPILGGVPKDAWKRDFIYTVPGSSGKPFNLYSLGKDNEAGSADDINVWTMDDENRGQ